MIDILYSSASKFRKLIDTQYILTFGRKNKLTTLKLEFDESNFYHLAGLHKLRDLPDLRKKASIIYDSILQRSLTLGYISNSHFFNEIEDRLRVLQNLESILGSENTNWKYCQERTPFYSKIQAEFLIEHRNSISTSYIFIANNGSNLKSHSCISCFEHKQKDYTQNQTFLTLLEKKKLHLSNSSSEIIYQRDGYSSS